MKAVVYEQFGEPAEVLAVRELPTPEPQRGEVLVRMIAAPINPSDLMSIRGEYARLPELPATPGYEGVGVVEASGGGLLAGFLKGKRVAVGHRAGGTWAERCVVPAKQVVPLSKGVPDEQGAMFFVNPVTAFAMTRRVLNVPPGEWLLQTAAGSALGRMVMRIGRRYGFRTLNVVRRAEQISELKAAGGDAFVHFHPQEHPPERLREEVSRAIGDDSGVKYAIDPVAGATGSAAAHCLGPGGRLLVFGSLSGEPLSFSPRALITPGAAIEGFWLTNHLNSLSLPAKLRLVKQVGRLVRDNVLTSEVGESLELDQIAAAVAAAESSGRSGKVLLRMNAGA